VMLTPVEDWFKGISKRVWKTVLLLNELL
jgi:hypothetical protein